MYIRPMRPVRAVATAALVALVGVSCTGGSTTHRATNTPSPTAVASRAPGPCAGAVAGPGHGGGSLIAYWSESPYPSLRAMRPDGSGRRRIAPNHQNAKRPSLSPDLEWVVFDGSPPGTPPLSQFHVQLVRIDGTGLRTLVGHGDKVWDMDAQWSPDGRLVSFDRMLAGPDWRHSSVWTVLPDGTGARKLGRGTWPKWSPDGTELALSATTPNSDGTSSS